MKSLKKLSEAEKAAWLAFKSVCTHFLGNNQAEIYEDFVGDLVKCFRVVGNITPEQVLEILDQNESIREDVIEMLKLYDDCIRTADGMRYRKSQREPLPSKGGRDAAEVRAKDAHRKWNVRQNHTFKHSHDFLHGMSGPEHIAEIAEWGGFIDEGQKMEAHLRFKGPFS
ncbi:hypothetical protein AVEN_38129-1 [Araneus ventricosus]|uniref:Uncharacterized protein n=1 Tax=Araneus ventricosus TaxID=182803 RepID=A0A4Y2HY17_ARAVE|nr:hypothetical protein AVEN_38129-1 [Araneus ventricosus]